MPPPRRDPDGDRPAFVLDRERKVPFDLDPARAARNKLRRDRRYNVVFVPIMRLVGLVCLSIGVLLTDLANGGGFDGALVWTFATVSLSYGFIAWVVLWFAYGRVGRLHLGDFFFNLDVPLITAAIYASGGEESWLFFVPAIRVADQVHTGSWRSMWFAQLTLVCYVGLVAWMILGEGRPLSWTTELGKYAPVYLASLYIASTSKTAEVLRARVAEAVRVAREAIWELEEKTEALDRARDSSEQASRAKSEFLANMSHEIRTPLNGIIGFGDKLLEEGIDEVERADAVGMIRSNGQHLMQVINDILDISKIEAGHLEVERIELSPYRIAREVVAVCEAQAKERGIGLVLAHEGPVPETIRGDPTRLRQVLLNLVSNALKFTTEGEVRVTARLVEPEDGEPRLELDVADTGIGMSPEQIERVFQAFVQADTSTTRKYGGTGLGLPLSRHLVELMGGSLTATSTPGEGSVFRASVATGPLEGVRRLDDPTRAPEGAEGVARARSQRLRLSGRYLVAEDNPVNQKLARWMLERAGGEVVVVDNGLEARDAALAAVDEEMPFDAVLMDMQMPVMDGYQAVRELRDTGYGLPILALTAHAMSGDREKCLAAGCDGFLTKPIDRGALLAELAALDSGSDAPARSVG